jgi:hypothetical protein
VKSVLREREDYQRLILERLNEDNGYVIRDATHYGQKFAMDTELLFSFLESTQPDIMEKLRRFYQETTEQIIINHINNEINKENRSLLDVLKNGVDFDSGAGGLSQEPPGSPRFSKKSVTFAKSASLPIAVLTRLTKRQAITIPLP